ncbi:MAG: hypothetical protein H0W72_01580 [Planctomycetes bacterium]|nr:hypothetical protein [Planctomycetota bacterium]
MIRQRASTLIVVSGLAMLLLSLGLTFIMRMRADAQLAVDVLNDAQARAMLVAGMSYVCETSRLGWGVETFGWNDIRDHAPGPRKLNPRTLPNRALSWTAADTAWPAPGSTVRCPMYVMRRTPYAIKPLTAPNQIQIVATGQPIPPGGYRDTTDGSDRIEDAGGALIDTGGLKNLGDFSRMDPVPAIASSGAALPLPAADYAAFAAGDRTPLPGTREHGWFRVYREDPRDHNGVDDPLYIDPYYDTIDLNQGTHPNVSVFVVTCGSGATAACLNYAEAASVYPNLFLDSGHFDRVRAAERLYWYRIEWSPFLGDSNAWAYFNEGWMSGNSIAPTPRDYYWNVVAGQFGSIRWTQRLDREPPKW